MRERNEEMSLVSQFLEYVKYSVERLERFELYLIHFQTLQFDNKLLLHS